MPMFVPSSFSSTMSEAARMKSSDSCWLRCLSSSVPREPPQLNSPYLLYCGRIDPNKGCATLFDYFLRFKAEHPSALRLVLTGKDDVPVPDHADIDFRGFVSAEEKFSLMAGGLAEAGLARIGLADDMISALEARALWARYGL